MWEIVLIHAHTGISCAPPECISRVHLSWASSCIPYTNNLCIGLMYAHRDVSMRLLRASLTRPPEYPLAFQTPTFSTYTQHTPSLTAFFSSKFCLHLILDVGYRLLAVLLHLRRSGFRVGDVSPESITLPGMSHLASKAELVSWTSNLATRNLTICHSSLGFKRV